MNVKYASAVERAKLAPDTFGPTTGDELADLAPGDFVKVCIEEVDGEPHGERLWVEVKGIDGGTIFGTLANNPVMVPLAHGDRVEFGKACVFEVHKGDAQAEVPPPAILLTVDEARLLVDVAVKGTEAGRGDEFKALLQRLSDASGYTP